VERHGALITILVVSVSLIFLFLSSTANAESRKDGKGGLAAELQLETSTLPNVASRYEAGKDRMRRALRGILLPLKEGVNAFLDLTPPVLHGLETNVNHTEYRAVIGFHFPLR
jgi:hypothetical protein